VQFWPFWPFWHSWHSCCFSHSRLFPSPVLITFSQEWPEEADRSRGMAQQWNGIKRRHLSLRGVWCHFCRVGIFLGSLCRGTLCGGFLGPYGGLSWPRRVYSQGGRKPLLASGRLSPLTPWLKVLIWAWPALLTHTHTGRLGMVHPGRLPT